MITIGNAGTYVAGTTSLDLPRPTEGRRKGHIAVQPRCPKGHVLVRPGAFHLCLDLSKPEPVVVKVVKKPKPKKAPKARVKKAPKMCADCGKPIAAASVRCSPCANLARRVITPERDREIAAMYLELRSAKRVADHFGVTQFAVADSLDRSGIERPGMGGAQGWRALSETAVSEIVAEYEAGASVMSISAKRGISDKTVYKALHHRNAVKPLAGRKLGRAS